MARRREELYPSAEGEGSGEDSRHHRYALRGEPVVGSNVPPEAYGWSFQYPEGYPRELDSTGPASEQNQRSFRGRGPKGYERPDQRIQDDLAEQLARDRAIDASEITIEVAAGLVTLRGQVPDRAIKRRVEDIAASVLGVVDVQNLLRTKLEAHGYFSSNTFPYDRFMP